MEYVIAPYGEITLTAQRHLFGMARTAHHQHTLRFHPVHTLHVIGYYLIFIRHDTLHRRHHEFIADIGSQLLHVTLEVRRRHHEQQRIGMLAHIIDIRRKFYALDIKFHIAQISRIMTQTLEILYAVVASHIPHYRFTVVEQKLGKSRSPAPTAHHCYCSGEIHIINVLH